MTKLKSVLEYSRKLKLLYVEDDAKVREATAMLFNDFFSEVVVGVDGKDAYEKFSLDKFDLIITDINMPRLNGLEMIAKIRKRDLEIPILVLSAYNNSTFLMDSIRLGVEGYLLKPIEIEQFLEVLDRTVSRLQVTLNTHKERENFIDTINKHLICTETDEQGIITAVSEAFCKISGYKKEELIGFSHNIVRHPDMPENIFEAMWKRLQDDKFWEGEVKNLSKDGTFYWLHIVISLKYNRSDGTYRYNAMGYDITDKKALEDLSKNLELKIEERTFELESSKKEIEATHKHTRDSIKYASLIQGAIISQESEIKPLFKDSFVHWIPKDIVGGDIWLFNTLRNEEESLLFFIDCTGHGVPGAFVTMIVKAIEREVIAKIKADRYNDIDVSPAWILGYFNRNIKILLKQETKDSISNAGWDGGIIYYNRRTQILKFAGAETPLFYIDENQEFQTIKGNRYSVGYKKCAMDYEYKETILEVKEGMKFYCTTDGYLDQNGGVKDFPFGKKRFGNIIKENHSEPMENQKVIFIDEMTQYEAFIEDNDRNDDMTVIAFEIGKKSDFKEDTTEDILKYEGVMTQNVIASCMDNIEYKIQNMGMMGIVSTITIEYCQNIMNYSKNKEIGSREIVPMGTIGVQYINDEYYNIIATNIVSKEDKEKIEPKLIEVKSLDRRAISARYKELRKSGQNTHAKGGGIGMYEIAKVSDSIEYEFVALNEDKYRFMMKSVVKSKKARKG